MKNDKVIVAVGIVILLIAAAGVYFYKPAEEKPFIAAGEVLNVLGGVMKDVPNAIEVADSSPFYALIATPLAVHYDKEGNREVIPMYIKNMTNPSRAVIRTEQMVGRFIDLVIDGKKSPKEVSLELAEKYWGKSDLALIIKDDKEGYEVGLVATPIASYLSIPVIVTDKIDSPVIKTLSKLKVRYILICGNLSTDAFKSYKIETPDDALNITIDLVEEKFGKVGYITLANPIDAWPPRVLDKKTYSSGVLELTTSAGSTQVVALIKGFLTGKSRGVLEFEIPKDYKYALVKIEVINLDHEGVDLFGDVVKVEGGIIDPNEPEVLQSNELISFGVSTASNPAIRNANGEVVKDRFYHETLLYNRGGAKYNVRVTGTWLEKKTGRVLINVEVDKLENPYYAMAKKLSTVAPYLTAYHKGIVFAKPDFAFYPDDTIRTQKDEKCSGFYSIRKNPKLIYAHNKHVLKIHESLNKLLAKLADIPTGDLRSLRKYYKENPIYIAIVGDGEMIPRIIYNNPICPISYNLDKFAFSYGIGTPSDFIYGNIDPIYEDILSLSYTANDTYSYYPYQENIVGRLLGWDAQDVSAQIVRTIFYYDIIDNLGDWKNRAAVLVGGGQDFQRPPVRYLISKLTGNEESCIKLPTGYSEIMMKRTKEKVLEPMGFKVSTAFDYEAMAFGLSDEALTKLKNANLLNKLFLFRKHYVAKFLGEDVAKGKDYIEKSNFILINAHSQPALMGACGPSVLGVGWGGPLSRLFFERVVACIDGGWVGPGSLGIKNIGEYTTRNIDRMKIGPSVIWLNGCNPGRITGVYPVHSVALAFVHSGAAAVFAPSMESNIAGGYLEPKKHVYDTPWSVWRAKMNATRNAKKGIYPDVHFGYLLYEDTCKELMKNATIGLAFRNAKNAYLPKDANSTFWWSPPLMTTGNFLIDYIISKERFEKYKEMAGGKKAKFLPNKYFEFQEWELYGDPAFNPYVPGEAS